MPSLVQIRNVPESTRRHLKARAAARGQSLNSYLLELMERDASQPDAAELEERIRRRGPAGVSTEQILDARADGRRG